MSDGDLYHALTDVYTSRVEYNVSNKPVYAGEAAPGTLPNEAGWRIQKITYDVSDNPLIVEWASGNQNFDKVWDERSSYTYT